MAFRDRMRVSPSKGELKVLIELQNRGLLEKMNECDTVVVFYDELVEGMPSYYKIVQKEKFTHEMAASCDGFTIPDFPFLRYGFAGYLDGPVHKRRGVHNRDDLIDQRLRTCGIKQLRFPFKPPLSDSRCKEIVDEMEREIIHFFEKYEG